MAQPPKCTLGRLILTTVGLTCIAGPYTADFSHTHILNPNWPPHAKFHNGQTMSMGLLLGLLTLYYTWRPLASVAARKDSTATAALFAALYWISGISAIWYPGTAWVDPEFVAQMGGKEDPQLKIFTVLAVASAVGWGAEVGRLRAWEREIVADKGRFARIAGKKA